MTSKIECKDDEQTNPIGYSIFMYHKSGGCMATWRRNLSEALDEVAQTKPHDGIIILKTSYDNRMDRHVIERAKNLRDSGIYTH